MTMKLRGFIFGAIASVIALASCENLEQNLGVAAIDISTTQMTFAEEGGDQELNLTATRAWKVETEADWVVVNPESGEASTSAQKVTVSALANEGLDRTATLKFTVGMKYKYLTVTQAGPGGSAEAKMVYYNDFQITKTSEKPSMESSYGIWDDKKGTGSNDVTYAFAGKVSVRTTGKLSDNQEAPEPYSHYAGSGGNKVFFGAATSILKIQNITLDSSVADYNLSFGVQRYGQDEADNTFNPEEFKVYVGSDSQKWVPVTLTFPTAPAEWPGDWNLASAAFTLPAGTASIGLAFVCTASSLYSIDDVLLEVADEAGAAIDFAAGETISGTTAGDPSAGGSIDDLPEGTGEGTLASPYDAAKATRVASALADGEKVSGVYVKGKIKSIKQVDLVTYGSAHYYLTDADGKANFYVYGGKYLGNTRFTSADQIKVGDEVVVLGDLINYMGNTPEMTSNNYIVELNGSTEGPSDTPDVPETPVEPGEAVVVTVAQFLNATDNSLTYQVSGVISGVYQAYSSEYNNISIYITDDTGEMLAYRLSCEGIDDPANTLTIGDKIVVKGTRTLYNEKAQMAQGGVIVEHEDVVIDTPTGGATLSFASTANRTVFTTSQQVWEQNGIKLTNDKGSSTSNVADYSNPARFYKSSNLTIEYPGMTRMEFTCGSGDYAKALQNSIKDATVNVTGSIVTVVLPAATDSFAINTLSAQVRVLELKVWAE